MFVYDYKRKNLSCFHMIIVLFCFRKQIVYAYMTAVGLRLRFWQGRVLNCPHLGHFWEKQIESKWPKAGFFGPESRSSLTQTLFLFPHSFPSRKSLIILPSTKGNSAFVMSSQKIKAKSAFSSYHQYECLFLRHFLYNSPLKLIKLWFVFCTEETHTHTFGYYFLFFMHSQVFVLKCFEWTSVGTSRTLVILDILVNIQKKFFWMDFVPPKQRKKRMRTITVKFLT